jgi:phage gp46-like protein
MSDFQGDVLLLNTQDGGDILFDENNFIMNDTGFSTAIYLTLFSGNDEDDGTESTKNKQYWGNLLEKDTPERKLTSRTQNFMKGSSLTPGNLIKLKELIKQDLSWFLSEKIVDKFNITASIPSKNRVNIVIEGMKDKNKIIDFKYESNWLSKVNIY